MSTEKAPLTNKLILLVLALILGCLVILLAQRNTATDTTPPVAAIEDAVDGTPAAGRREPVQYAPLRPRSNSAIASTRAALGSTTAQNGNASTARPAGLSGRPDDPRRSPSSSTPGGDAWAGVDLGSSAPNGSRVVGRVTLLGAPPPATTITATDRMCGGGQGRTFSTRHYVVSEDGGLANVFVWITGGIGKTPLTSGGTPLLDQIGCEYTPYVMGVQTGQKFKIRNSDPGLHNVHAMPRPGSGNREFNLGQPLKGMVTEKAFDAPEVFVRIKCDVHPWMFAYVGVVDHPFFAVTDTNGFFQLPPGLPPGRYTLAALHLKAGEVAREINIREGEQQTISFTLGLPAR